MRLTRLILCLALVPLSAADAQLQSHIDSVPRGVASVAGLRPGDIVRLRIWREPDLSGDFPVDEIGRVNLPLVGTYSVSNETRESLQEKLVAAYKTSVQNLSMDVIFLRRIPVVGAVRNPGLYPVDATMTVADAVALAGGSTREAEKTSFQLMRNGKVVRKDVDPASRVNELVTNPGDQIYVPTSMSYFERNPWAITTIIQSAVTLTVALITIYHR